MKNRILLGQLSHRIRRLALLATATRCAGNRPSPLAHGRPLSLLLGATMVAAGWVSVAQGATININPSQDNSIYQESDNSNALGSLFAGTTTGGNARRALLQFSLSAIPAGST